MERLVFTCVCLIISGFCQDVTLQKPQMTPPGPELIINEGKELRLMCQAKYELQFSEQTLTLVSIFGSREYSRKSKAEISTEVVGYNWIRKFVRTRVAPEDTGWYACANVEIVIKNDDQTVDHSDERISWIYVYVNSSQPFSLAGNHGGSVLGTLGAKLVIPCRPTSPDLPVSIEVNIGELPKKMRFDPKIGFIIDEAERIMTYHAYTCISDDKFDQNRLQFYIILRDAMLPTLKIGGAAFHHLVWGEDLHLECTITCMNYCYFGYPYWKSKYVIRDERFVLSTDKYTPEPKPNALKTKTSRLTIRNTTESDSGEYACATKDYVLETLLASSMMIKFWDPSYTYLNATVNGNSVITKREGDSAGWRIIIDSYPNATVEWYNNRGIIITDAGSDQRSKYSLLIHDAVNYDFIISTVSVQDSGVYSIRASNANYSENITLTLRILAKPEVVMKDLSVSDIAGSRESAMFSCESIGLPLPSVEWQFEEYPHFPLREGSVLSYPLNIQNENGSINDFYDLTSSVNMTINATGDVICEFCNGFGCTRVHKLIFIAEETSDALLPSLSAGAILFVVIVIVWLCIRRRRKEQARQKFMKEVLDRFDQGALNRLNPTVAVCDQAELLPYNKKWEYPRKLLKLDKVLGKGAFGVVWKAQAKSICRSEKVTTVAVKMVRSSASLNYMTALNRELKILAYLGKHLNVVNLLGACTKNVNYGELFVIVEYCRFGNLRDYLLRHKATFVNQIDATTGNINPTNSSTDDDDTNDSGTSPIGCDSSSAGEDCVKSTDNADTSVAVEDPVLENDSVEPGWGSKYDGDYKDVDPEPISTRDLLCWAWQVSRGMEYLSSRKVVHGDLAARNILLADDGVVKICDFGLSRALYRENKYKMKGESPLPIKWMAIESIKDRVFSIQSDIWSFGIVMWELFTLGRTPYPGVAARDLYQRLTYGLRMGRPRYSTENIYRMMLHCWRVDPSERPSFRTLSHSISDLIGDSVKTHYIDLDGSYMELNAVPLENGEPDYLTMILSPDGTVSFSANQKQVESSDSQFDEEPKPAPPN